MSTNCKTIKCGSRSSRLAVIQVDEVRALLKARGSNVYFDLATFETKGDKDKKVSLVANRIDDFFTDTIDSALLNGGIDIAVHSAKDLPENIKEGLDIFALTAALDETDAFVGKVRFQKLKDGAKIGTSSEIRQQSLKELNPHVDTIDIRGTIEERLQLVEDGVCDGIIVATAALKRLGLEKYIKDIMPWEAAPLQGQLAIVGRSSDADLRALFSSIDIRRSYGRVVLVGAGPGDPDLITMKGIKALHQADCVFYDYLTNKNLLHYAEKAEKINAGKRKGAHTLSQKELSKLLREKAVKGKNVVRLKGGDPLVFGRGAEEIEYLQSYHIDVQVIPGVSSATAIPSSLGVPLTARDTASSVAFISGHGKGEKESQPRSIDIPPVDTIVFLMGLTKLDVILKSLKKAGWKDKIPVLIISKGTCDNEKIISGDIGTIAKKIEEQPLEPPALIVVGPTVKFWNKNSSRQAGVLYTGTNPEQYRLLGNIVHLPMIQIEKAPIDEHALQNLIGSVHLYDMILFTSRFAVEYFFQTLNDQGYNFENLNEIHFVVIGKNTAKALRAFDLEPSIISEIETSEGLLAAITKKINVKGKKILFPRSSIPNPLLKNELSKRGAQVDQITIYQNKKLPKRNLPAEGIKRVLFTSPSTVKNFLTDYRTIPGHWQILSKGPVTKRCLKEAGYESEVLACE